jgi:hypothetical protein
MFDFLNLDVLALAALLLPLIFLLGTVAAGPRTGAAGTINLNSGNYGTPTWTNIPTARDVTMGHSWDEGDTSRKGSAIKSQEPTLLALDLQVELLTVPADAAFASMVAAFYAKTDMDILVSTGVTTASSGEYFTRCDYKIFSMEDGQPLDGEQTSKFTLKPCYSTNPVTSGAL